MSKWFEANAKDFGMKNPKAQALLSFADAGTLQLAKDAEGVPILVDTNQQGKFFYHSPQSAAGEAKAWAQSLPLDGNDFLVVFGIGLGYGYFALQEWLSKAKNRRVIFLEDDLRVLLHFLESENGRRLLDDPQVQISYIEDSEEGGQLLQSLAWGAFDQKMAISALPFYETARKKTYEEIKSRLLFESSDIHLVLDEYMTYGVSFFRNFWKNLFLLPGSYAANKLHGAFRNIPAIVVGAGPSLAKHLEQIKELKDSCLIFAGGSSVNALLDAGIRPHFGAGIDPNPTQYLRFRQSLAFGVPFFFRNRLLHESLALVTGPRLYLKGGDGYNISDWFEKKLRVPGRILGGGHSIANFIIEIAAALGCNPIILVGYDLAYGKELELYAPGVELGQPTKKKESYEPHDEPVKWPSEYGNKVHTAWKWLVEAKWIEDFARGNRKVKVINATEGGLGIKNIPHLSLKDAVKKYVTLPRDLESLVHTAIQEGGTISQNLDTLFKGCAQMYDSLEKVKGYLDELASIVSAGREKSDPMACLEDPETILLDAKLKQEVAYSYILEVFDRMRIKFEYYKLQFASHPKVKERDLKKFENDLLMERLKFLKETAVVNQILIAQTIEIQQAQGKNIKAFQPKSQVTWV